MSARVAIVVRSQGELAPLERQLPVLTAELEEYPGGGEIRVVDASGRVLLGSWMADHFPAVPIASSDRDLSPAEALLFGARSVEADLLLALEPAAAPQPGFLAPLIAALDAGDAAVAGPAILAADGRPGRAPALVFEDGRLHVVDRDPLGEDPHPVPFPPREAFLLSREFLACGGLDPMFAPFSFDEVDLGVSAWRSGRSVLRVPASRVELVPEAGAVPEELARAAREKNRLLLFWKYLDTRHDAHDHLALLWRDALEAAIAGRREELCWMALALQELPRVGSSRGGLGPARRALEQVLRVSAEPE